MEIHWHSTLSSPSQVGPGAALALSVVLETLPAQSPLLPLPLGCYLASPVGLVEGLGPGDLRGCEPFPGQEDFARLHSPSPQGIFQGVFSDCLALGPDAIEQFFSCAKELVGGCHSAMCFFNQQLGAGPWMPVGSLGTGQVMAEGPEVHPGVGGPLGATHPPSDTAVTRMALPPWPEPRVVPTQRAGRAEFRLFVHGPSWQHWHSSRRL